MKLRLPRRRLWRVAIYLGSSLLVLVAADMILVQSRRAFYPGFFTTRIVSPVREDGAIDYVIAVDNYFGEGVTPLNNAAVPILQALGRSALAPYQPDGVADRLGMTHLPENGDYFVIYDDFCKQHSVTPSDWTELTKPRPWPVEFDQLTTQWVSQNEKPLAMISEASKRTRFFIPFYAGHRTETMIEIQLRHLRPLRDACRALQTRGLMRLAAGDVAGFRQDFLTVHRLTRLIGQAQTAVDRILAMTVEISACEQQRVGISSGKIPPDEARAMAAELGALGDLPGIPEILDKGERYFILDALQSLAHRTPPQAAKLLAAITDAPEWRWGPPAIFMLVPIPYDGLMRQVNQVDDAAIAIMRDPSFPRRVAALELWREQLHAKDAKKLSICDLMGTDWPAQIFVPSWLPAIQREETARMESRLTQVSLALTAFKGERAQYPASLQELSPVYLAAVPNDTFVDKPLIYSRTETGYKLYSVGPNMTDDGGKSDKPADDLIASLP